MNSYSKNRPLTEALCEFFFVPQETWDMTIPGIIYSNISDKFPIKRQEIGKGIAFRPTDKGVEQQIEPVPPRLLFFNQSEDMLIQVSPNVLSVNIFRSHIKWKNFKQLIKYALIHYLKASEPEGLSKIGLRYITRFDIEDSPSNMDRYLRIYPQIPSEFPRRFEEYELSLKINYRDNQDYLMLHSEISDIDKQEKMFSLLLDLNYCMDKKQGIDQNQLNDWLDVAHSELNRLLIKSLTDKCKETFGMGMQGETGEIGGKTKIKNLETSIPNEEDI